MNILAIESSCDETAASVISDGKAILSNIIASQAEIHARYGGVVPEVAARSHVEVVIPVVEKALSEANLDWDDIDAIGVTRGPGLIGSLMIGVLTAQALAVTKDKPLIGVNHIWAHAYAGFLIETPPTFPFLALTVSGGHTTLSVYRDDLTRQVLGQTLDDAAGEAFDKVAKLIGLGYPGGPAISQAATSGDDSKYQFPVANTPGKYDFSFSGLKTAVLRQVQQITGVNPAAEAAQKTYQLDKQTQADLAASFQKAVVDALVQKALQAYNDLQPNDFVIGGGVACNSLLREHLKAVIPGTIVVPPVLCTDNAAMIGALAYQMAQRDMVIDPTTIVADPSLSEL